MGSNSKPAQTVDGANTLSATGLEEKAPNNVNEEHDTTSRLCDSILHTLGNTRRQRRKSCSNLPDKAPLYVALVCALAAITFSVRTHISTRLVSLEEPFRVSPFFKDVKYIGLSTWELCSIKQDALEDIMYGESMKNNESSPSVKLPLNSTSISSPTYKFTTLQSNSTTIANNNETYPSWLDSLNALTNTSVLRSVQPDDALYEPDSDDVLASGDFPYNNDDAFDSALPLD